MTMPVSSQMYPQMRDPCTTNNEEMASQGQRNEKCDINLAEVLPKSQVSPCQGAKVKKSRKGIPLAAMAVPADEVTTLMFRGIPCSFSQDALLSVIDDAGFKDKYNFFYLPRDGKKNANLGYAFINFVDQQSAELCSVAFEGVLLSPDRSKKMLTISAACIQGLASLRKHFHNTAVTRASHGPMFLTPEEVPKALVSHPQSHSNIRRA